jgi:hypothetical protein
LAIIVGVRQRRADRREFQDQLLADRRERQDEEARQVTATVSRPDRFPCQAIVSAPLGYQVKQLTVRLIGPSGGGGETGVYREFLEAPAPAVKDGRLTWTYEVPNPRDGLHPLISFVDRHGSLYYQYRGHTQRFPADTEWASALGVIQGWLNEAPRQP